MSLLLFPLLWGISAEIPFSIIMANREYEIMMDMTCMLRRGDESTGGNLLPANDDTKGMSRSTHAAEIFLIKADFFSKKNSAIDRKRCIYPL